MLNQNQKLTARFESEDPEICVMMFGGMPDFNGVPVESVDFLEYDAGAILRNEAGEVARLDMDAYFRWRSL